MFQEISTGVYRIPLPHPALYASNAYLIAGERPILIDGGHFFPPAQTRLHSALAAINAALPPPLVCLTDATPDRVGYALTGAATAAHADLAYAAADYNAYSLLYRRELVVSIFEDAHIFRRFNLDQLQATINLTYGAEGSLAIAQNATTGASWDLGRRKLHAVPAPGTTSTHVAYWLEPDGILFSGDIGYGQGLETPSLIHGLGANVPTLLATIAEFMAKKPRRVLPAAGEPLLDAQLLLERSLRAVEQLLAGVQGMLCSGPREMARLLDLLCLGHGLSPLRLTHKLAALRVALTALMHAETVDEIYEEGVFSYRLSAAAMHARRQAA